MPPNNEFTTTNPNTVPQPQTVNMILASLGGPYTPQGGGNTSPAQQGWVPPQSRDDLPSKVLYGDSAANASADVTYDSAFLVLGMLPRRAIG